MRWTWSESGSRIIQSAFPLSVSGRNMMLDDKIESFDRSYLPFLKANNCLKYCLFFISTVMKNLRMIFPMMLISVLMEVIALRKIRADRLVWEDRGLLTQDVKKMASACLSVFESVLIARKI